MKKSYLKVADYNRLLIIGMIERLLKKQGAQILTNNAKELVEYELYTNDDDEKKIEALRKQKHLIAHSYNITNAPSLCFILNSFYYEIEYDENPFFPIHYQKIKIDENGEYIGARYLYSSDDLNDKSWAKNKTLCLSFAYDNLWGLCSYYKLRKMAFYHLEQIKREIINGSESAIYTDHYHPRGAKYSIFKDNRSGFDRYFKRPKKAHEIAHKMGA